MTENALSVYRRRRRPMSPALECPTGLCGMWGWQDRGPRLTRHRAAKRSDKNMLFQCMFCNMFEMVFELFSGISFGSLWNYFGVVFAFFFEHGFLHILWLIGAWFSYMLRCVSTFFRYLCRLGKTSKTHNLYEGLSCFHPFIRLSFLGRSSTTHTVARALRLPSRAKFFERDFLLLTARYFFVE